MKKDFGIQGLLFAIFASLLFGFLFIASILATFMIAWQGWNVWFILFAMGAVVALGLIELVAIWALSNVYKNQNPEVIEKIKRLPWLIITSIKYNFQLCTEDWDKSITGFIKAAAFVITILLFISLICIALGLILMSWFITIPFYVWPIMIAVHGFCLIVSILLMNI